MAVPYGSKTTYRISPSAVEIMKAMTQQRGQGRKTAHKQTKQEGKPHQEYLIVWRQALEKGLLTGKSFSPRTVGLYMDYANEFFLKTTALSPSSLEQALSRIPADSISKRQNFYKALVCLGKYLIKRQALEPSFLESVKPMFPKRHIPPKRLTITPDELQALFESCESFQDRVLLHTLASTGLRNAELCALNISDLNLQDGWLEVRRGKGGKRRRVGLASNTSNMLAEYLQQREGEPNAPLFLNIKGKRLDNSGLFQRIERIGKASGIKVNPHALRRSFVTINANKGRPLQMLQIACGHSDIKTTMSYCLTAEQEVIDAMKRWD